MRGWSNAARVRTAASVEDDDHCGEVASMARASHAPGIRTTLCIASPSAPRPAAAFAASDPRRPWAVGVAGSNPFFTEPITGGE